MVHAGWVIKSAIPAGDSRYIRKELTRFILQEISLENSSLTLQWASSKRKRERGNPEAAERHHW